MMLAHRLHKILNKTYKKKIKQKTDYKTHDHFKKQIFVKCKQDNALNNANLIGL